MLTREIFSLLALGLVLSVLLSPGASLGQNLYIYPSRGQSPEQQSRDRYECHTWAVQQTGFDPTVQAATPPQGGVIRGAATGATVGVVGGAIAGDAGKGAAIGAATGGLIGGMRQASRATQQSSAHSAYTRALGACLNGRGYTVQ